MENMCEKCIKENHSHGNIWYLVINNHLYLFYGFDDFQNLLKLKYFEAYAYTI